MSRLLRTAFLAVALVAPAGLAASISRTQVSDSPEAVIRQLVIAIYSHDAGAYNRVTTDHPLRSRLTAGGTGNPERLRRLTEDPASLQIRENRPKLFRGKPIEGETLPAGTTALYTVAHGGGPMVVPMVRRAEGWKVDVRWWIAGQQMSMSSVPPPPEQLVIREMLAAMLVLDKTRAARYLTDARGVDVLFAGAPRSREPSGVLEAAVFEMPLVEISAGEFYQMPSGRLIEGGSTETRSILVGLFGPVEMPFVLTRTGGNWRVEAEPYFALMLR